jgi:hypothetical protein
VEGARPAALLAGLPGPAADGEAALAEVLRLARELAASRALLSGRLPQPYGSLGLDVAGGSGNEAEVGPRWGPARID